MAVAAAAANRSLVSITSVPAHTNTLLERKKKVLLGKANFPSSVTVSFYLGDLTLTEYSALKESLHQQFWLRRRRRREGEKAIAYVIEKRERTSRHIYNQGLQEPLFK